jgi:hypothetical protein
MTLAAVVSIGNDQQLRKSKSTARSSHLFQPGPCVTSGVITWRAVHRGLECPFLRGDQGFTAPQLTLHSLLSVISVNVIAALAAGLPSERKGRMRSRNQRPAMLRT